MLGVANSIEPLAEWPARVAMVTCGNIRRAYPEPPVWLTEGDGKKLEVIDPSCLGVCATRQSPPVAHVVWDIANWLPNELACDSGALNGNQDCWKAVWDLNSLFADLICRVERRPYAVVLSEAQLIGEHSPGAELPSAGGERSAASRRFFVVVS